MFTVCARITRSLLRRTFSLFGSNFFLDPFSWTIIRCKFDGIDYVHKWRRGALVWFEPTALAIHITNEDIGLFVNHASIDIGDSILIAGAGMGSELNYFSNAVSDTGIILAIEPDRDAFRRLSKLVKLLRFQNVVALNVAVASENGEAKLLNFDNQTVTSTTVKSSMHHLTSTKVVTRTIESICRDFDIASLDYLKMNIEGAEFDALLGVGGVQVSHFCISCHDFLGEEFATRDSTIEWLIQRNFQVIEHEEEAGKPWVGSYVYGMKLA
jgi:FkbM family methyltransferase